jgi:hypothetical protein
MDAMKWSSWVLVLAGFAGACAAEDAPLSMAHDASTDSGGSLAAGGDAGSSRASGASGSTQPAGGSGSDGASSSSTGGGTPDGGETSDDSASDAVSSDVSIPGASLTADSVVAAANLVAWYRFKDQKDPGADSSKTGTNGAFFGDGVVVSIDPLRGYVGVFDGTANEAFPPSVQNDMTLSLWLQTSTPGTGTEGAPWLEGSALLDGESGGPVNDYGWTLLGSHVAFGVGNPDTTFDSKTAVIDGKWHHLAVTRDNTTGTVILYLDGMSDGGGKGAAGKRDKVNAHLLTGSGLVGRLSDIRLYDRVLTPVEIVKLTME